MHPIDIKTVMQTMYVLGGLREKLRQEKSSFLTGTTKLTNKRGSTDPLELAQLIAQMKSLDLPLSVISAERLIALTRRPEVEVEEVNTAINELMGRVRDELGAPYLLSFSSHEKSFLDSSECLYGALVSSQFPSLIHEIESGSKCLGFGLPTAAAFHFIRCLEGGIAAMSACLAIPSPTKGSDRSWMKLLRKIKDEIDRRWPSGPIRTGDAQFFEETYGCLAAIQNPYRNATMHLDHNYDLEEAKHIAEMVGGFMKRLAKRMDESGLPLA